MNLLTTELVTRHQGREIFKHTVRDGRPRLGKIDGQYATDHQSNQLETLVYSASTAVLH